MNINETKIAEIVDVLMDDYNKDRTIDEIGKEPGEQEVWTEQDIYEHLRKMVR